MKKLIVSALFGLCLHGTLRAQIDTRPFVLSLTPELSLPVGKFANTNKLGFGGNLVAQFKLAEKLRLLASIGGVLYQGKSYETVYGSSSDYNAVGVTDLKGGLKYYLLDAVFVAGHIGINRVTQGGESKMGVSYTPILGAELGGVDLYVKYNVIGVEANGGSNIQTVSFCIGYRL